MGRATLDQNFRPTAIGVDHVSYIVPTEAAVKTTNHAWLVEAQESTPIDASKVNPSMTLSYDISGNLLTMTKTIGSDNYQKTLGYTSGNMTSISSWVQI